MKVTIIGGGGRVGSNAAFALQCAGIVSEIQILDANVDLAEGEALDLLHGSSCVGGQRIYAGDYARAKDSDVVVITAGLRRKPDESRLDLINRNVALFSQILADLKKVGLRGDAHVFVVSNPVDILTQLAAERLGLPSAQVYGLGTMLDTARFRSLIARDLALAPTQVEALILGEHGDTMVPIWSSAAYAGLLHAVRDNLVGKEETIVVINTGSGLKDVNAAIQVAGGTTVIEPTLEAVESQLKGLSYHH